MARRRNLYGRKKKVKYAPLVLTAIVVIIILIVALKIINKDKSVDKINEIMSENILKTSGAVYDVTKIDTKVYENKGIRYSNQHEGITKINTFDSTLSDYANKAKTAENMLDELYTLQKDKLVSELPSKENGYYWFDINLVADEGKLMFKNDESYNIDLYYDKSEKIIYIKDIYYDEFSTKNNKVKLQGFKVDDEYDKLIQEMIG